MQWYVNVVLLAAAGVLGWAALEFVARPFRQFFDLRRQLRQQLFTLANIPQPKPRETAVTSQAIREYDEELKIAREAQRILRDLGSQMSSFYENEFFACNMIKYLGFDAIVAGRSLIGLSNTYVRYGVDRANFHRKIENALRF
jgi:hypothetical protein